MCKPLPPPHPSETILEDVLKPLDLSIGQLAKKLRIARIQLDEIVHGRRSITADMALRLSQYLGTSADFWLNLQMFYDLRTAQAKVGAAIARQVKSLNTAA